jgi:hypothetical protein
MAIVVTMYEVVATVLPTTEESDILHYPVTERPGRDRDDKS